MGLWRWMGRLLELQGEQVNIRLDLCLFFFFFSRFGCQSISHKPCGSDWGSVKPGVGFGFGFVFAFHRETARVTTRTRICHDDDHCGSAHQDR